MFKPIPAATLAFTLLLPLASPSQAQNPTPLVTKTSDQLIALLKSDAGHKDKADACRQLAVIGTPEAVPTLISLLADPKLAHMARYSLETIPGPAVDQALREQLDRLNGRPLVGVIASLGVRKDPKAVQPLSPLLSNPDDEIAQAAARALGKIGTPQAAQSLQIALPTASNANRLAFCEGALRCAESLAAHKQRKAALTLFDQIRQLPNTPHQVRAAAVRAAILMRPKVGLKILQESLRHNDYIVFAAAIRAALECPRPGAVDALAAELTQLPVDRQIVVLQTLGQKGDAAALPILSQSTAQGDKSVRLTAVRALGQLGNPAAAPTLVPLLIAEDRSLAQAAHESLASLQGPDIDSTVQRLLASQQTAQRLSGIELVARRRMTAFLPDLLKAAGGPDPKIRPAALRRVGELGATPELTALLELSERLNTSDDLDALEQALSALSSKQENPQAAATPLITRVAQAQPPQKGMLLRVLSSIGGPDALKIVRTAAADPNPELRAVAIRALGSWHTADAGPDLLQLAKTAPDETDRTLCLRSFLGLAAHTDLPGEQRLAMCRDAADLAKQPDQQKLLLSALSTINSVDSVALMMPYLNADTKEETSSAVVTVAGRLLRGRNAASAAPHLIEPLTKVSNTTANPDLAARAKTLLQQAQTRTPR